jgi:hypothetical protein
MDSQGSLSITLTKDEALVLFELMDDFLDEPSLAVRDQAERRAIWNLAGRLRKAVPEVFSPNYKELVEIARKNLSW